MGIRFDHNSQFGGQANPRLSVAYKPVSAFKVSGNVGRAFRAPTFEDLYSPSSSWPASMWGPAGDTKGNESLKPERAWGYDCGVEGSLGDSLVAQVTAFRSDVRDLIAWSEVDPDPNYEKWRPVNVGRVFNQGIEAGMNHKLIMGFEHGANYTYLESKGRQVGQAEYKTLMYSPRHRAGYRLDFACDFGLKAGVSANYTHRVRWDDSFGTVHQLPGYTVVDARISQRIGVAEAFFAVDNIFDRRYQSREYYPLPGRSYYGGASVRW
jgi:outer membrane receptor for ferrienterochelin and colicin